MQNVEKINIRKQEVFDSYFRRYYQILCYFACHYLKEQDEAEDVVQEVFMKLRAVQFFILLFRNLNTFALTEQLQLSAK